MKVKNFVLLIAGFWLLAMVCQPAGTEARVDVGINLNLPLFTFHEPPELAVIPGTYIYYVPDIDADIYFYRGSWYRNWGNRWHRSRNYNGPWSSLGRRHVPGAFFRLPSDYRHRNIHERMRYRDVDRHWQRWEKDRHWEKGHDWWRGRGGRDRDRDHRGDRGDRRDHREHGGR